MGDVDLWKSSNIRKQSTRNLMYMEHLRICQDLEIRQLCQNGTNAKDLSYQNMFIRHYITQKRKQPKLLPFHVPRTPILGHQHMDYEARMNIKISEPWWLFDLRQDEWMRTTTCVFCSPFHLSTHLLTSDK